MILALKLLAPYVAVGIFWCVFPNAWLAILAYHAQILFWAGGAGLPARPSCRPRMLLVVLPAALAGPLLFALLPFMLQDDLASWLHGHGLSRLSFLVMVPYFGILHPVLEQIHWAPLREHTPLAHFLFAGYHVLVLYSLLATPWLVSCFLVLTAASFVWQQMAKRSNGLSGAILSHQLADLGIVIAAWLRLS